MEYIKIGVIVNTFGIKGELKIYPNTDFDRFSSGNSIYVKLNNEYVKEKIEKSRFNKNLYYCLFTGYSNINEVLKYKGCDCYILKEDQEPLNENEYYYGDLLGLKVYNQNGVYKGVVDQIREVPQGEILEVMTEKGMKMVPFHDAFIKEITKDKIIVEEIEGLF